MIGRLIVAGALGVAVSATGALAADLAPAPIPTPAEPAQTCDFFQAQLIGLLCGHTAYVAPGVHGDGLTNESTTSVAPAPPAPGGVLAQKWDYKNTSEVDDLRRFALAGGAILRDRRSPPVRQHIFEPVRADRRRLAHVHEPVRVRLHRGMGGRRRGGDALGHPPEYPVRKRALRVQHRRQASSSSPAAAPIRGAICNRSAGGRARSCRSAATGLSLNYLATNLVQHFDNPGLYDLQNTTRVLLASDAYGWAVGPRARRGDRVVARPRGPIRAGSRRNSAARRCFSRSATRRFPCFAT